MQYFIGLKSFSKKCPFRATSLVAFRKRLDVKFLIAANELYLETVAATPKHKDDKQPNSKDIDEDFNLGTAILDATCSPSNIEYPQDFTLLNTAREKLEEIIDYFHKFYHPWKKPRTYRRVAQKEYLKLAKTKQKTQKAIRSTIRKQLGHVARDLRYIDEYMVAGYVLPKKYIDNYLTIIELYRQQKYMFDNKTHKVENRIVSINQPYIRPIVCGKVKMPVEFGAKYDVSIDEKRSRPS